MKVIKRFFHIVFWGFLIAGVIFLIGFVDRKHGETVCESFDLVVMNGGEGALTDESELRSLIIRATDTLTGKTLSEIEPIIIHNVLDKNPYIESADIQTGINGNLLVSVTLRKAICRVINANGLSYYLDRNGWIMPVNAGHPSRVHVISGNIKDGMKPEISSGLHVGDLPDNSPLGKIHGLSLYLHDNIFLNRLISQVYIDKRGEFELVPLVGDYTIYFGTFEDMEEKFEKLLAFYHQGAGKAGWIDYRSVDLRYRNQVICSK